MPLIRDLIQEYRKDLAEEQRKAESELRFYRVDFRYFPPLTSRWE